MFWHTKLSGRYFGCICKRLLILLTAALSLNLYAQGCNPWLKRTSDKAMEIIAARDGGDIEGAYQMSAKLYTILMKYPARCQNEEWIHDVLIASKMIISFAAEAGHCETSKYLLEGMTKDRHIYIAVLPEYNKQLDDAGSYYKKFCTGGLP